MIKLFITGGTSGLGEAIIKQFAKRETDIEFHILAQNEDKFNELQRTINKNLIFYQCDLRQEHNISEKLNNIHFDYIILNAGCIDSVSKELMTSDTIKKFKNVNLHAIKYYNFFKNNLSYNYGYSETQFIIISSISAFYGKTVMNKLRGINDSLYRECKIELHTFFKDKKDASIVYPIGFRSSLMKIEPWYNYCKVMKWDGNYRKYNLYESNLIYFFLLNPLYLAKKIYNKRNQQNIRIYNNFLIPIFIKLKFLEFRITNYFVQIISLIIDNITVIAIIIFLEKVRRKIRNLK